MSIEIICREVSRIMRKYDEPDPWKLAEAMGIIVQVMPLGSTEKSCKGFFLRQSRKKHITINSAKRGVFGLEYKRLIGKKAK